MARAGLDERKVIEKAAELANMNGIESITMKTLADYIGIKPPSLYNHVKSQADLCEKLMIYGWSRLSEECIEAVNGLDGKQAFKSLMYGFYNYAMNNKGVFEVMLWYNQYSSPEFTEATIKITEKFYEITRNMNIPSEDAKHLLRTYRAFIEGYALLVIHNSFGNPISIEESLDISLEVLWEGTQKYCSIDKMSIQ